VPLGVIACKSQDARIHPGSSFLTIELALHVLGDLRSIPRVYPNQRSRLGTIRSMNSLNIGTVKAVSPWPGLHIMPLLINCARVGPNEETVRSITCAMSPDRWGPAPSLAMALKYFFCEGVSLSNRTRKKLWSRSAIARMEAGIKFASVIGESSATSQRCFPQTCKK